VTASWTIGATTTAVRRSSVRVPLSLTDLRKVSEGPARAGRASKAEAERWRRPRRAQRAVLISNYGRIRQYCGLFVPEPSGMLKQLPPPAPINVRFWERYGSSDARSGGLRRGDRVLA
jgi:hypothetical protein